MTNSLRYNITLENLANLDGSPTPHARLQFEVKSHSDIVGTMQRLRQMHSLPQEEAAALSIGLELFQEILTNHQDTELFRPLMKEIAQLLEELQKN